MGTDEDAVTGPRVRVRPTVAVDTPEDLAKVYTPGVADTVRSIADQPDRATEMTTRGNAVAVLSDRSAVLGHGDVGALAACSLLDGRGVLLAWRPWFEPS